MLELRPSKPEEIPAQKALWALTFGDDDRYIDDFYRLCAQPSNMLVLLEDGVLRSMLALLPVTLALPDGDSATSAYIYALATDPAARSQGFGRMLLQYVDFYLGERGIESVTTVPAEASLHRFFASNGFSECFATRKIELLAADVGTAAPGDGATPIGYEEYGALREMLLKNTFHGVYPSQLLAYQQEICRNAGGDLYQVNVGEARGCAAVERGTDNSVLIKELVIDQRHIPAALTAIAATLPAARYHLRTPALWPGHRTSYIQPFAMIKWYSGIRRRTWGEENNAYFGLAFD